MNNLEVPNAKTVDKAFSAMVFVPDTLGEYFDKRFNQRGWNIDSCKISSGKRVYQTAFDH